MAVPPFDLDRDIPDLAESTELTTAMGAEVDHLAGRYQRWCDPDAPIHPALRARALLTAGRPGEAAEALGAAADRPWSPQALGAASWCVARIHAPRLARAVSAEIDGLDDGFLIDNGMPLCPVDSLRANLAMAEGNLDAATRLFGRAVERGDLRAPLWGALARLDLGRVRLCAANTNGQWDTGNTGSPEPALDEARRYLGSARTFFAAGGYEHLLVVTEDLVRSCAADAGAGSRSSGLRGAFEPGTTEGASAEGASAEGASGEEALTEHAVGIAHPCVGHMVPGGSPDSARSGESTRSWLVGFGVQPPVATPHRLGLVALRHLISQRGREVPAVELVEVLARLGDDPPRTPGTGATGSSESYRELQRLRDDPTLDPVELARSVRGLLNDDRARSRTAKLLRRTIASLADRHRLLAEHLERSVSTGYTCAYRPSPTIRWWL